MLNTFRYIGTSSSSNPNKGEVYYDINTCTMYAYDGSKWISICNTIVNNQKDIYAKLWDDLCQRYPNKVNEFYNILKLCNEDYRQTCLIIENSLLEE